MLVGEAGIDIAIDDPQVSDISAAQKHVRQLWGFSFRLGSQREPSTSGNETGEVDKKDVSRPIMTPWFHSTYFQSMIPDTKKLARDP